MAAPSVLIVRALAVVLLGWASGAHAHVLPADDRGSPHFGWSFEPWVVGLLIASGALYLVGYARLRGRSRRSRPVRAIHLAAFVLGWLALVAALDSPLDTLADALFSAHMIQHEVLMLIAAPLLVIGRPFAVWIWALPATMRGGIGRAVRTRWIRVPWRVLTMPLVAWMLHAAALWAWHAPALFEAALARPGIHTLQHASFLVSALLFWWTVFGNTARGERGAHALLSLFTTMVHTECARRAAHARTGNLVSGVYREHQRARLRSAAGPATGRTCDVGAGRDRVSDRRAGSRCPLAHPAHSAASGASDIQRQVGAASGPCGTRRCCRNTLLLPVYIRLLKKSSAPLDDLHSVPSIREVTAPLPCTTGLAEPKCHLNWPAPVTRRSCEQAASAACLPTLQSVQVSFPTHARVAVHPVSPCCFPTRLRMDLKFWKTEKHAGEPTPNWPVDTHEALRQLVTMYLRADTPPFSTWAARGIEFASNVAPIAQNGAKGYQLALWFWLFAEKHGALAARMARESFCLLANEAQPGERRRHRPAPRPRESPCSCL